MNGLRDGVAVHGAPAECVEDEQVEGSLQQGRLFGFGQFVCSYDDLWEV